MNRNIEIKNAVLLAAGKGSRLCTLDSGYSKPMTPVFGKPLISYALDALIAYGIENIFIIYHSTSADVLNLKNINKPFYDTLNFVEDTHQKGGLSSLYYAESVVNAPFLLLFADIIVKKEDFIKMMTSKTVERTQYCDLLIQTVDTPSIPFEKPLLIRNNKIVRWNKSEIQNEHANNCTMKSGGMIYLWFKNPFYMIKKFLDSENYSFSEFMNYYIERHNVSEMKIDDLWDIDTLEDILKTESLLGLQSLQSNMD